ncbi:MAG: hypothetical protein ACK5YR_16560 [Pirellula sp.]|jgi:hypothetical protein
MPAYAIPKIEWKNQSLTATRTGGSNTLTSVTTTNIEVGMLIEGTGIPSGTTVLSKTVSTVVMSANAISPGTSSLDFLYRISLQYPPIEPTGAKLNTNAQISESLSGVRQVSIYNIEEIRTLSFSFLTETIKNSFDTFLKTHGCFGQSFRYFEDATLTSFNTYELEELKPTPKKIVPKGLDQYIWEYGLKFRRVL